MWSGSGKSTLIANRSFIKFTSVSNMYPFKFHELPCMASIVMKATRSDSPMVQFPSINSCATEGEVRLNMPTVSRTFVRFIRKGNTLNSPPGEVITLRMSLLQLYSTLLDRVLTGNAYAMESFVKPHKTSNAVSLFSGFRNP